MLQGAQFDFERPRAGLELELNLVDAEFEPALKNAEVLAAIADPNFVTELGQFNLEINLAPHRLIEHGLEQFEAQMRSSLNAAEAKAQEVGAHMVMIGILPTLGPEHTGIEAISANPRYSLMNEQIFIARGEDIHLSIDGPERIDAFSETILPEAACTSAQLHLQVSPDEFPQYWNAAQCLAAVQVALAANSPYFFGRELWRETRIALFEQAADTRPEELRAQGVRPRVWFGERWITSIFDLFEENVTFFPALLPILDEEDPVEAFESGRAPSLAELTLHNGTIWRWNRPVYATPGGVPHVRVENRVLPAGPTVVDVIANAAFYFGAVRKLATGDRPIWSQMSFGAADDNFHNAARDGIGARIFWPRFGEVPVTELALRELIPLADDGLAECGVDREVRDRLLGVIQERCLRHVNGASWQVQTVHGLEARGADRLLR